MLDSSSYEIGDLQDLDTARQERTFVFNALLAHIRNLTEIGTLDFKKEFDRFLKTAVDVPLCRGYTAGGRAASNSL